MARKLSVIRFFFHPHTKYQYIDSIIDNVMVVNMSPMPSPSSTRYNIQCTAGTLRNMQTVWNIFNKHICHQLINETVISIMFLITHQLNINFPATHTHSLIHFAAATESKNTNHFACKQQNEKKAKKMTQNQRTYIEEQKKNESCTSCTDFASSSSLFSYCRSMNTFFHVSFFENEVYTCH